MLKFLFAILPSRLKIWVLRRNGSKVGRGCYIGLSILNAREIEIGDFVHVGHFNLIWRLKSLRLNSGSRISMGNWITGATEGWFELGRNSAITRFHFIEASSNIKIGNNCIVAGRASHFFSHGISATNLDDRRSIQIGNWCYIGSSSRFVPGAGVSDFTFVGMGSVVTKQFTETYVLIGGSPACVKKNIPTEAIYFNRSHLPHAHHPADYKG